MLLHLLVIEFVHRWNLDMAFMYRGLSKELIGGFYNQHVLEDINSITEGWFSRPVYPLLHSVMDFADNGECLGLRRNNAAEDFTNDFDATLRDEIEESGIKLTKSATEYARLTRFTTLVTAVRTDREKEKFKAEYPSYLIRHRSDQNFLDAAFSAMAHDWNKFIEQGRISSPDTVKGLSRKTGKILKEYYDEYCSRDATQSTMRSHFESSVDLRQSLRAASQESCSFMSITVPLCETPPIFPASEAQVFAANQPSSVCNTPPNNHNIGRSTLIPTHGEGTSLYTTLRTMVTSASVRPVSLTSPLLPLIIRTWLRLFRVMQCLLQDPPFYLEVKLLPR
jgi:hypothetical protein